MAIAAPDRLHYTDSDEANELLVPQLIGSFAAIWDDILPPVPEAVWHANLDAVVAALG